MGSSCMGVIVELHLRYIKETRIRINICSILLVRHEKVPTGLDRLKARGQSLLRLYHRHSSVILTGTVEFWHVYSELVRLIL